MSWKTKMIRQNTTKYLCKEKVEKLSFSFCRLSLSIPRTISNLRPAIWWSRKSLKRLPSKKWNTTKSKTLEVSTAQRYASDNPEFDSCPISLNVDYEFSFAPAALSLSYIILTRKTIHDRINWQTERKKERKIFLKKIGN